VYLNDTFSKFRIGQQLTHVLFRIVWKTEILYRHCYPVCCRISH